MSAEVFSWFSKAKEKTVKTRGAQINCVELRHDSAITEQARMALAAPQIDMLIDRADKTINVCEMKFWSTPYVMTAKDEEDIERRLSALMRETGTDKQVIVTLITTKGLVRNEHSEGVQKVVLLEELFS